MSSELVAGLPNPVNPLMLSEGSPPATAYDLVERMPWNSGSKTGVSGNNPGYPIKYPKPLQLTLELDLCDQIPSQRESM